MILKLFLTSKLLFDSLKFVLSHEHQDELHSYYLCFFCQSLECWSVCRFSLGSRAQANRYIQQFTEIFTEEGRKSVRITHVVPNQAARVICTAGMRERDAKMAALVQQQQQTLKQVPNSLHRVLVRGYYFTIGFYFESWESLCTVVWVTIQNLF